MHDNVRTLHEGKAWGSNPIEYALQQAKASKLHGSEEFAEPRRKPEIPGFEIIREIGRGAQAAVFEARQESPRRRVALKVLLERPFRSKLDEARFLRESDILGRLVHPNIVPVLQRGSTDRLHYFVMPLIAGVPLSEWMRGRQDIETIRPRAERTVVTAVDTRQILGLFVKVCDAVNAAHLAGVIHRDLKPSNILVDADGEPHVLDFGLGRLIDAGEESCKDHATVTVSGMFLGSLAWTSPEQAEGRTQGIDTRTDVYALGVILFHLLTKRFPYSVSGPYREVFRNIAESEPTSPRTLNPAIDRDLDAVVLACLEKDRDRRYRNAGELADDLRAVLNGEPIHARQNSTWYVYTKALRRHRKTAVVLITILLLSLGSAITMTVLYQRARQAERTATSANDQTRRALRGAYDNATFTLRQVVEKLRPAARTREISEELVQAVLLQLETLLSEGFDDPEVRAGLAQTRWELSDIAYAVGDLSEASRQREAALGVFRELVQLDPVNREFRAGLSKSLVLVGDVAKDRGDAAAAISLYEQSLAIDEQLAQEEPDSLGRLDTLCWSYDRLGGMAQHAGDLATTEQYYEKRHRLALELQRQFPADPGCLDNLRTSHSLLARLADAKGLSESAREHDVESLRLARLAMDADPGNDDRALVVAGGLAWEANFAAGLGDYQTAEQCWREAVARTERVANDDPAHVQHQRALSRALVGLADLHIRAESPDVALPLLRRAETIENEIRDRIAEDPTGQFRIEKSIVLAATQLGDEETAARYAAAAIERARNMLSNPACSARDLQGIAEQYLTSRISGLRDPELAATLARRSVEMTQRRAAGALVVLGRSLSALGRLDEAQACLAEALTLLPRNDGVLRPQLESELATLGSP